jgi:hypothetical protein
MSATISSDRRMASRPRNSIPEGITHVTPGDVETGYRSGERRIFLSDVVDARNGETMSVGFARYAPGNRTQAGELPAPRPLKP